MNPLRKGARGLRSTARSTSFEVTMRMRGPGYIMREFSAWCDRMGAVFVLRALGAQIGDGSHFEPGLRIQNATNGNCANLVVGNDVWVGPEVLIDLKDKVTLEDRATIAGRVSLVTHHDVGVGPLSRTFPPKSGRILIRTGSFLGFGATVLHGVSVGPEAMVGAGSVVTRDISQKAVAVGVPAKVVRTVGEPASDEFA